ncbi:MAG TPA: class I SAM-dependent methyltransferase [Polyangiaceae bacterium]|nr:class I SAM-dependent methyltransferase [Polyangiaceae bacterium]
MVTRRELVSAEKMEPKPIHLGPDYARQFDDESIARAYHSRPPYPLEAFEILAGLLPTHPTSIVDLGCGTGDIALGMLGRAERIIAVDPSSAMLRVARRRPGADHPSVRWVSDRAENFAFGEGGPHSLVVAAESLHWMQWEVVLPKIARSLEVGASLAIVNGRSFVEVPWSAELAPLLSRFSTNRDYRPYDLTNELQRRGLFVEAGRRTTSVAFSQSIDDYTESFHTRNGFSRQRMTAQSAAEFDRALRRAVSKYSRDGIVRGQTLTELVWGTPRA